MGREYPPLQPTRGSGEASCELPLSPNEKRIWCILNITEHFCLQDIVNDENSILQAKMQYAMKTGQQT